MTVFELGDSARHDFIWGYLFHYPGLAVLRATSLQHSRSAMLSSQRRHLHARAERAFSGGHFLRAPLLASRLVVVPDRYLVRHLESEFPELAICVVPVVAAPAPTVSSDGTCRFQARTPRPEIVERAAVRARAAGADVTVVAGTAERRQDDVVIALEWPPTGGPPTDAVRAMAAGLPTMVFETEATAAWPLLDPQTWQPRGFLRSEAPIGISIDPRDEEHSLMLAMRRLATDATLRRTLGASARAWASNHASLESAVAAWRSALRQAMDLTPAVTTRDLPAHLVADGTERARRILGEFDAAVDFLT